MQSILDELKVVYEQDHQPKIQTAKDVSQQLIDIKDASKEIFVAFYLNTKNQVIAREIISIGILDMALIHPRETFRSAIIHNAHAIIIAHNHPGGNPEPSTNDKDVTNLIKQAGELLGIKLLDHVIVSNNEYKSLKEMQLL